MEDKVLKIFSDGGARGNPGPAASAYVVYDGDKIIDQGYKYIGKSTNNIAEYIAVIMALKKISTKNFQKFKLIDYYLDSQLIVKQLRGEYKVKSPHLKKLVFKIKDLEKELSTKIKYIHIERSKNKIADSLVNKCLDENS